MNIVCISASQVPSSAANSIQVMKACQALAQLDQQVSLLVPQSDVPGPVKPDDLQAAYGLETIFPVEWLPARRALRRYDFSWRAVQRATRSGAGLVYAWPLQAALFASLCQLPVILELHGPPEGRLGPLLFRLFLAMPTKKRLLVITRALSAMLERDYRRPLLSQDLILTPNGVDLERYQNLPDPPEARRKLGFPGGLTAGYTGHLYPGRGMTLMVELARRFPAANFLWIGGRPEEIQIWRGRLEEQGISNVLLPGFVPNRDLPLYQAAADILLMPYERTITGSSGGNSAEYCSPMKMFEYMACGRAILSSDLPAIREVLNEANATLCPPDDPESWALAFDLLARDEAKRTAFGCRARQDVEQFTWRQRARNALAGFVNR